MKIRWRNSELPNNVAPELAVPDATTPPNSLKEQFWVIETLDASTLLIEIVMELAPVAVCKLMLAPATNARDSPVPAMLVPEQEIVLLCIGLAKL